MGVATGVDDTSVGEAGGDEDDDEAAGVGVGELVEGRVTGQVETFVVVGDGCAGIDVTGVETGAVRAVSAGTPVGLGTAPVTTGSEEATHLALDVGCAAALDVFRGDAVVLPGPVCALAEWVPPLAGVPLPVFACVPLPSVSAPLRDGVPPPLCEVLDWRIAWRTGWTPSITPAMTPTPASTVTNRSHLMSHCGKLLRRDRHSRRAPSPGSEFCHAQCPRQVQLRAQPTTPRRTLNSQGRGRRPRIRARILSSPSEPGSTPPAASDRARLSLSSRLSSSGEVMPSPHLPAASSGLLLQDRLERCHCPRRVTFHGASTDPHRRRDVGLGEVTVVPQDDGFALPHRERAQRRGYR